MRNAAAAASPSCAASARAAFSCLGPARDGPPGYSCKCNNTGITSNFVILTCVYVHNEAVICKHSSTNLTHIHKRQPFLNG